MEFNFQMFMKRILLSLIVAVGSIISGYAQVECWSGKLSVGPSALNVEFVIKSQPDGSQVCTLNVPAQGAKNIPTTLIKNTSDSIEIAIPLLNATYAGRKVSAESAEGAFTQHGVKLPLSLKLGGIELNRPQTPVAPFPYHTEEVTFKNEAEGAVLSGTLTYPIGYEQMAKDSVPVVLMVTGSGAQNRDEEMFGHKPFLVIADFLARNGVASLRYDDRGVGKSTGSTVGITTENNFADAKAGVSYLRSLKEFGKIGVLGHSEGGTIAFMLGADKSVDFLISLAGSSAPGIEVIVGQNKAILQQQGLPQTMISDYASALRILYQDRISGKEITDTKQYVDQLCVDNNLNLPPALKDNLEKCISAGGEWFTWFLKYDPAEAIKEITCPVMALNGDLDMQVLSRDNLPVIEKNLPHNEKSIIKEYRGLNHLFQHATPSVGLNYGSIEETISEEVLCDIHSWIEAIK